MSEKLLATRAGYGDGIIELGKKFEDVVVLEGDLGHATGSLKFKDYYPDRYYEMGIAEQNMVGVAAGMALVGLKPFVSSFAMFTAGRALEIVRNAVCFNAANVKLVGSHAGITPASDGGTHMCIEDLGWMKTIPTMTVVNPCDYNQTKLMVEKLYAYDGPCYMRTSREPVRNITSLDDDIEIGKGQLIKDGKDLVIFSTGIMTTFVYEVVNKLKDENIDAALVNIHTIKPLDEKMVLEYANKCKKILVVEEHNIYGGLTESIARCLIGKGEYKFDSVSVNDKFGETGNRITLFPEYGLDNETIYLKAKQLIK